MDLLLCPRCGFERKPIAVTTDPAEVRTILRHLPGMPGRQLHSGLLALREHHAAILAG